MGRSRLHSGRCHGLRTTVTGIRSRSRRVLCQTLGMSIRFDPLDLSPHLLIRIARANPDCSEATVLALAEQRLRPMVGRDDHDLAFFPRAVHGNSCRMVAVRYHTCPFDAGCQARGARHCTLGGNFVLTPSHYRFPSSDWPYVPRDSTALGLGNPRKWLDLLRQEPHPLKGPLASLAGFGKTLTQATP